MDRREFLGWSGRAAGLIAAGSVLGRAPVAGALAPRASNRFRGTVLDHPVSECPIEIVVVLMMENRSFDHYLSWLAADDEYLESGRSRYGGNFTVSARNDMRYRDAQGELVSTLPVSKLQDAGARGCGHKVPGHGWFAGRTQRDHGFLAEGTGNDLYAVSYQAAGDIPVLSALTQRFTLFDHYHSSLLGPTFPNRQYLHTAQSEGRKEDPGPLEIGIYKAETIWDRLDRAGVTSRYYYTDLPLLLLWGERFADRVKTVDDFLTDAQRGELPQVVFIDPGFTGDLRTDDHPQGDVRSGQRFIAALFDGLVRSPQWRRSAFIVTYDEWGGFFDHVRPPRLADNRASANDDHDFAQAGFRVPTVLASPHARPGWIDHRVYDHTSILRFLEWRFLGAPPEGPNGSHWWLTKRDRHAHNIGHALHDGPHDLDPGYDATVPLPAPSASCGAVPVPASIETPPVEPFGASDKFSDLIKTTYLGARDEVWFADIKR